LSGEQTTIDCCKRDALSSIVSAVGIDFIRAYLGKGKIIISIVELIIS
jgi:hypothetical protein